MSRMRARAVNASKAYVFDFDDTLVKTDAKVHVVKDGKRIKSLTPDEFNFWKPKEGETTDMSDFDDPRIIMDAKKYKMWPALKNINMAKKSGRSDSDIFILTARAPAAQLPIHNLLRREGIDIPLENVITIGHPKGKLIDIAARKRNILTNLADKYDIVHFFDDSHKNVKLAGEIPGIKSRLIDSMNENIQRAKKVFAANDKDTTDKDYQKLLRITREVPGLMGKFAEWLFSGTPMYKLHNIYNIEYKRAKKRNIKLRNIDSFDSFEEYEKYIKSALTEHWKKQFSTGIPKEVTSLFNDKIWEIIKENDDKLEYLKHFLKTHGRRYKSSNELYDVIKHELETYRNIKKKEYTDLFGNMNDEDAEIIYEDEKNLLIDIKKHKALKAAQDNKIISKSYCFGDSEVWCNLIEDEEDTQQYFWFNFNHDFRHEDFLITFTFENGKITRIGTSYGEIHHTEDFEEVEEMINDKFSDILYK